jgi:hypothetical protein
MPLQERYAAVSNKNSIKAKSVLILTMNTERQSSNNEFVRKGGSNVLRASDTSIVGIK